MYTYHSFFIHSSLDVHLGCFHVLDIADSAAVSTGVHVPFRFVAYSGYMPSSGIAGSCGGFIPSFQRNLHTVLHSVCTFLPTVQEGSTYPPQHLLFVDIFDDGHSDWCEVIPHCSVFGKMSWS